MNARVKLNNAAIHGSLAVAGLVGWLSSSFEIFLIIAAVLCATALYGGDIRTTPRRK